MKKAFTIISILYIFIININVSANEYKQLSFFRERLAIAQTVSEEWVVINERGVIIFSLSKLQVRPVWGGFYEGLMVVATKDDKFGFIDIAGNMVVPPHYRSAMPFSEGLAEVQISLPGPGINVKWGYIHKNGEIAIPLQYDRVTSFHEGRAFVRQASQWYLIDTTGKFVGDQAFEQVYSFSEGLAAVRVNRLWGFIDTEGRWKIQPCFSVAFSFREGLAGVFFNSWSFIDKSGTIVFNQVADTIPQEGNIGFWEGPWAIISTGNKKGYLNKDGRRLPAIYDSASYFSEGVAMVMINGKMGAIDETGKWVIQPGEHEELGQFNSGIAVVKKNGKFGAISQTGNWVIQPEYEELSSFRNGTAIARKDGKIGYINTKGEWLF